MELQNTDNLLNDMIKEKSIPKYVYRYSKISKHLYESLINSEIWFASPASFNDPFDSQYDDQTKWDEDSARIFIEETININCERIDPELIVRKFHEDPDFFPFFVSESIKHFLIKKGLCCFSSNPKKILMWSHYADSHRGVCIKFDISKDVNLFEFTQRINYSWRYPKFDYIKDRKKEKELAVRLFAKSRHWEYEEEIRTIKTKPGLYGFNKECLKEIIFGMNSNTKEIIALKQIVESNYNNVKFKKVQFKKNSFKIKFEKI